MFNSKGQASSVFNILIAGIIALAILGILLSLLGGIITPQGDIKGTAQDLVKDAQANPYNLYKSTQPLVFRQGDELTSKGIVSKVPALLSKQVCVVPGALGTFFTDGGSFLQYTKAESQSLKLAVYCGSNDDETDIMEDLETREYSEAAGQVESLCNECLVEGETCCVVFPVRK